MGLLSSNNENKSAVKVHNKSKGKLVALWLVVSREKNHKGLCYLLVKSPLGSAIEVAHWAASKGYGWYWKIEVYHRHVKQEYKLEDIHQNFYRIAINVSITHHSNAYHLQKN